MNHIKIFIFIFCSVSCVAQDKSDIERYEQLKKISEKQKAVEEKFSQNVRDLNNIKVSFENIRFAEDLKNLYIAIGTLQDINKVENISQTRYYKKISQLKDLGQSWNKEEYEQVAKVYVLIYANLQQKKLDEKYDSFLLELVHDTRVFLNRRDNLIKK